MKWQSHLRIAEWVGSKLNFSKPDLLQLAKGSITPDKWRDHAYHHNHKYLDSRISERIIKARKLFLNQDTRSSFEIGVALHYIADRLLPETSYLQHLNIEEEIAKISESRKESKSKGPLKDYQKHLEERIKRIESLEIKEEEKTLLLDPTWTKGKNNTLTLALTNLPPRTDYELLYNIAFRISVGVTLSIISKAPPPQLLWERFKFASDSLLKAIPKFKRYLIFVIIVPLSFLVYGKTGGLAYFLTLLLNLWAFIPIILILRRSNKPKSYLIFRDRGKTLLIFFLIGSLAFLGISIFYNPKLSIAGATLFLITLLHLFFPKVLIDKELEEEIDWYEWN